MVDKSGGCYALGHFTSRSVAVAGRPAQHNKEQITLPFRGYDPRPRRLDALMTEGVRRSGVELIGLYKEHNMHTQKSHTNRSAVFFPSFLLSIWVLNETHEATQCRKRSSTTPRKHGYIKKVLRVKGPWAIDRSLGRSVARRRFATRARVCFPSKTLISP